MATGNSKASKSARVKLQLRDKKGRWIEMGGGVKWYSPSLGKFMFGTVIDATPDGKALVEIKKPNAKGPGDVYTAPITPSQLEKVKSKATLDPAPNQVIKPTENEPKVEPQVEKSNPIFKEIHKNPVTHKDPFGEEYESIPFDPKGSNTLEKNDLVTYFDEGVQKKGHVLGTDSKSGNPIIQPEISSNWGFAGKGKITPLDQITKVFKSKTSSPKNATPENKADIPVPAPDKVEQGGFGKTPAKPVETPEQIEEKNKQKELAKALAKEKAAATQATAKEKSQKLEALVSAPVGTRLLSQDETTINLVKQDAGYWTEEVTGTNYTSTQVAEKFAGEKGVSMIQPPKKPITEGTLSSEMTSEEFKQNLTEKITGLINDKTIVAAYQVPDPAYMNPGFNQAEVDAIDEYVGDSGPINQALRLDNSGVKSQQMYIAGLDSVLDKSALVEDTTVFRGIRANPTMFDQMKNGGVYHDKAFSSTSSNEKVATNWVTGGHAWSDNTSVVMEMRLPAGFKAHKIDYTISDNLLSFEDEEEVILPRNTAYKVISMEPMPNNNKQYKAIVEPVLTAHNSIKGTTNDGNTTGNSGTPGDNGGTSNTSESPTDTGGESQEVHSPTGGDKLPNGGTDGTSSEEPEQGPATGPEPDNETGPVADTAPAEIQELGKLYTDETGQYMAGSDGQKFRKGDTVSYTKKGETQTGKVIALYEGVKSARVEWPDGSNSIKKINTLKKDETAPEADTAPVESESAPAAEVPETPAAPETLPEPKTDEDFAVSPETHTELPFDNNLPVAVADIPVGSILKLKSNPNFALKKIGPDDWRTTSTPDIPTPDGSIQLAMGMSHNGKSSYDIHMPKETTAPEAAPTAQDVPEAAVDAPAAIAIAEEKTEVIDNLEVTSNENNTPGSFLIKSKDGSSVTTAINSLKAGDKVYPVGTNSKPYGTHSNYGIKSAFVNILNPAGVGTVVKNDPNKPYIQVEGADGNTYFPSKNFIAVKQNEALDNLIAANSKEQTFLDEQGNVVEESATPEELAEMEAATATPAAPINVSKWKKLKSSTGSNPGGEYEAPDGTHFFIKQSKSDLHAKNEVLASDIYQAAGVNSLELGYSDVDGSGKLGTIAPMLSDAKDNFQSALQNDEYRKEFQKGWAVDAWLGNWDVVGLSFDNALTDGNGKAIRIDPGGALLFRAMGSPKTDAMFGDSVGEWDSMRTDPNNYQAYEAFGDMTDAQVKESVAIVAAFTDAKIDELVNKHDFDPANADKLKKRLKNRRDDLIARANELPGEKITPELEPWELELLSGGSTETEEITNEDISPTPPVAQSPEVQEALDALKKKLQGTLEPTDKELDEGLAEWEKELLEQVAKEEAVVEPEPVFDFASAKPGTLFQNDKNQDAFVGKDKSEISYGKTVEYTKKGETKTGTVANIMVNQQSAKVVWADGSSSIIKASQLIAKDTAIEPDGSVVAPEPVQAPKPVVPGETGYDAKPWNNSHPLETADLPIGTIMGNKTDNNIPSDKYGWKKVDTNKWITQGTTDVFWPDSEMQSVKSHDTFYMYVPTGHNEDMPTTEAPEDTPSSAMPWAHQNGVPNDLPIGTKLDYKSSYPLLYTKVASNSWEVKNPATESINHYSDSDMEYLDKEITQVILPEGFDFLDPSEKSALDYPVGTSVKKGIAKLTKTDAYTWKSKGGLDYTNDEINEMSMPLTWIVQSNTSTEQAPDKVEDKPKSLPAQTEAAISVFEKVYDAYTETVGEENASWDDFTDEFGDYLPEDEENFVFINNKKFFIEPYYSDGPTMIVAVKDEFGDIHATVEANASYGSYDSYLLNTKLDIALGKLQEEDDEKQASEESTPEAPVAAPTISSEAVTWINALEKANELPLGSKIKGISSTFEKTGTNEWTSANSGTQYNDEVIDNLTGDNWKLEAGFAPDESAVATPTDTDKITKTWSKEDPSAENMPIGTQIMTGQDASAVVFEKKAQNQWKPSKHSSVIHTNQTMDELKNGTWEVKAPKEAFDYKPEPEVDSVEEGKNLAKEFLDFHGKFTSYFSQLPDKLWATAKNEPLEFEVDGTKFKFGPHQMSSIYAPYMHLQTADGQNVYSDNDFELNAKKSPSGFEASDVFNAAKDFTQINNQKDKAPAAAPVVPKEYKLPAGTTLADVSYEDFASVPSGTKINHVVNGMVHGTYLKNTNHTWRYQQASKDKPSHQSENNADFKFFMENNKEAAANYVLVAPDVPKASEEETLVVVEKPKFAFKHHPVDSVDELVGYPVGTSVKVEASSWTNMTSAVYYVKNSDGDWDKMVKTANTVSKKGTVTSSSLNSAVNSWYKYPVAVSIPTDDNHALLGNGEIAYVGDIVLAQGGGSSYKIEKINKTAINLIDINDGNKKVKIPAKKLFKNSEWGVKDPNAGGNSSGSSNKYDTSTVNPVSTFIAAQKAEKAAAEALLNFAGASGKEYDEKGLGLPVGDKALEPKSSGLSVIPVEPGNTNSPLFGQPKPVAPEAPENYPSFEESVLNGLPKWDSAEWLKKVEERYLQNPNKKFANVQKSTQWNKIEEVLKGNEGYKTYLNQLLNNKYLDQELFDMAEAAINKQEEINKPLKKAHQENVAKEKAEYEAKKTAYLAEYNDKVKKFSADLEEWSKVNVNAGAIKKLPKLPPLSSTPFTGGPADWSKAHPGLYSVESIMNSMRDDNVLGRFGLSTAVDSDRIEETGVTFNKVKDSNGVEKFEVKFKVTHAYGKLLNSKFKNDGSINKSQGIYYPKKTNMAGKPDDQLAKLSGQPGSSFVNSGTRFEFVDPNGAKVVFQHAAQDGQNISVNHNSVQLLLDVNATPADFQLALENLGIDAKPSTAGALRVLAENKLIKHFTGDSNWDDENFSGEKRAKALKKVKDNFNITADDVVVETDSWGRMRFNLSDAKVEEFMAKSGVQEFQHSVYAGEDIDVWESILSGTNPGLASNYFRGTHGIGELKSGTGMSPDKDMSIGSGFGIFVSAKSQKLKSAPYYNMVGINKKALMRRLDTWGNISDNYGKNDKGAKTPFQLMKNNSAFHELIVNDGIPVSDFSWVAIGSTTAKKQLIERLTAKGIFMINGIPLEKFILTNDETITEVPVVNTFGTGVAASGPAV